MGRNTFTKGERLNKEKLIKELFNRGSSFYLYPFKVVYLAHPDQNYPTHQVLISVSNRNFKKAVDRNVIKRRVREGYRLNKGQLASLPKWMVAYIYTPKEILSSEVIHKGLIMTFQKFSKLNHEEA